MKKFNLCAFISLLFVIILCFSSCGIIGTACVVADYLKPKDKVVLDLPEYDDWDFYRDGVWREHVDYGKYYYNTVDIEEITDSEYLEVIDESNIEEVKKYINDFDEHGGLFEDGDVNQNYDFDMNNIEVGDYFYKEYDNYDFYYFDVETKTLYFFDRFV